MFNSLIYKKALLNDDIANDIAELLLQQRKNTGKSLEEVSRNTEVELLELDSLECGQGDIDFNALSRLLDYYGVKIKCGRDCFPGLPQDFYVRYFSY